MARPAINPGTVDWTGENPGMYLKETADGPFVTLISFFRVLLSPRGRGHAAFILQDPHGEGRSAAKPNLCITDNEPLAEYLREGFVANFGAFRGLKGLAGVRMVPGWDFMPAGDGKVAHVEWFRSAVGQVCLTWKGLGDVFLVEMPKDKSATGRHEMFSLFVDAHAVDATINGRGVAGRAFPREFAGKKDSSTAFLAFSETWVKA
ncbi:MAG TPA: hypothetical protein VD791_03750 [Burkholderiales bacterium]|nr:hypothetical protein [Burkholderiales bacterium]